MNYEYFLAFLLLKYTPHFLVPVVLCCPALRVIRRKLSLGASINDVRKIFGSLDPPLSHYPAHTTYQYSRIRLMDH